MPRKKKSALTIGLVLDMSGLMESIKHDTIGGFNQYVSQMAQDEPDAAFCFTVFNSAEIKVHDSQPIKNVERLTDKTYRPNNGTPLLDAIGKTVAVLDERAPKGGKVALVILTDGQENASREYSRTAIQGILIEREKKGWGIVYLGANQDAFTEAGNLGIHTSNAINFTPATADMAFASMGVVTSHYSRTSQTSQLNNALTDEQKKKLVIGK